MTQYSEALYTHRSAKTEAPSVSRHENHNISTDMILCTEILPNDTIDEINPHPHTFTDTEIMYIPADCDSFLKS